MQDDPASGGVIGPNAVTRMAEALTSRLGAEACRSIFSRAGLVFLLDRPPLHMVDEDHVSRLHATVVEAFGPSDAAGISWQAGRLTAEYLLAHRIPRAAQAVLRHLPRSLAARVLVSAIARHAWTFAGSGRFTYDFSNGLELHIAGGPVCRFLHTQEPACHYYAATFEHVFAAMLGPRVRVRETDCEASGASRCVFTVSWKD